MVRITLMNIKDGTVFDREFEDLNNAKVFLCRCRYSKKVKKLAILTENKEEFNFLKKYL